MEYRAHVDHDPLSGFAAVRLVGEDRGRTSAATGVTGVGHLIMMDQDEGVMVPPFLHLPEKAVLAFRDAFNGHAPPTSDEDLREALTVERARVDKVINSAVNSVLRSQA